MAKIVANGGSPITADGIYDLGYVVKAREYPTWKGLFFAYGTFGGGTISWKWSPVGSTATVLAMEDYTGTAITSTANDSFTGEFATGSKNTDRLRLYASLAGSTGASITVGHYNNN